ncbi:MAG: hypothetical protein IIA87_03555 [Nanoarchaeota archaeon]|nr:hypothetical protein [Nanoarchaeota archaeon]
MENIVRDPEKKEMSQGPESEYGIDVPLITSKGKFISPQDKFSKKISEEQLKASKKGLPFAAAVARADVEDINSKLKNQIKRLGYISEDYKLSSIKWEKYSDLKNFEVIEEGKQYDINLSKTNRLPIHLKWIKYKFKGFSNLYIVMENGDDAVIRAQNKYDESSAKRLQAVLKPAKEKSPKPDKTKVDNK